MKYYDLTKPRILREQGFRCWFCGKPIADGHWHHGVIPRGRTNYKKFQRWLDMPENGAIVCPECDTQHGRMTGFEVRNRLFSEKIDLGYDMIGWLESIPMRVKENFHYLPKEERNGKINDFLR